MASASISATVLPTLSSYQTALAILLPPSSPFYQDISTLRALYDKNHKIWPPHINLLYPFVAPERLTSTVENIQKSLSNRFKGAGIDLEIKLDKAGIWQHKEHATVYLSDSGTQDNQRNLNLAGLRQELLELFESSGTETKTYTPHLTIGQTALDEEVMMGLLGKAEKLVGNAGGDGICWNACRLVVLQRTSTKTGMKIVSEIVLNNKQRLLEEEGDTDGALTLDVDVSRKSALYHVYAYSSSARSYLPYTPGQKQLQGIQQITLATYNIFTESAIPTDPGTSRYPRLLSAILSTPASVLNLQEVTDDFLAYILSQPEIQRKFPYSTHSSSHGVLPSWRNCVSLSQYPIGDENGMWEFVDLGKRHKGAVVFELPLQSITPGVDREDNNEKEELGTIKKKKLVIANVHLTCGISDGSTAAKVTQLRILSSYFRNRPDSRDFSEYWAICGDLNIPTSQLNIQTAYNSNEISLETYELLSHKGKDARGIIPEMWQDTYDQTHAMNEIADIAEVHFDFGKANETITHDSALSWQSGVPISGGELALGPGELGATFNPFTNQLAAEGVKWGANPRPQRYDRILTSKNVSEGETTWMEIKRTGRFGLEEGSDHWGLYAEFRIRELGTIMPQGTKTSQKKHLRLEPRLPVQPEMTDAALEKYLAENGMLPSQKDYSIREEGKEVLAMILKESRKKRTRQTPISENIITPVRHVHELNETTQYHDVEDISTSHSMPEIQRLGVIEKPHVKIVVQPVGSYFLNLFTPNSDVDILCASNISARIFWVLVKQRIRRHNKTLSKNGRIQGTIRIVRTVEAQSGTMMELEYFGGMANITDSSETGVVPAGEGQDGHKLKPRSKYERVKMDLQYCQVPERVLDSWNQLPYLSPSDPIFSLSATTLKKLNAYRDSCYLLQTIPNLKLFRLTYRLLKLWAIRRGIFSARFGYLGGVHLVFLLSSLFKRISQDQIMDLTAGEILKLFFGDYAGFNYEEDTISDPEFPHSSEYRRTPSREPFAISTIHSPMTNVAHTASKHTLKTLRDEILLANQKLNRNCGWDALTGRADGEAEREFLSAFGNFVKIDLRYWGRNIARGRSLIGWIESRCVMLLVELNAKVPNMHARMWPGRFVNTNEASADEELNGFYLIGLLNTSPASRTSPPQRSLEAQEANEKKRQAYNKFMDILRSFEGYLREEEKKYDVTESYIAVTPVSRQAVGDGVRVDKHLWWDEDDDVSTVEGSNYNQDPNKLPGDDDDDSLDDGDSEYDGEEVQEEDNFSHSGVRRTTIVRGARGRGGAMDYDDDHNGVLNAEINIENNSILQVPALTNTSGTTPKRIGRSQLKREQQQRELSTDQTSTDPDPNPPPPREYIKKSKLRPAHDIINRIKWDPEMDIHDYIVGYEDRFLGTLEMGLEKWMGNRKDETEEDWVPMHRVVWIKRINDGVVVWDRERRVDVIFGSGDVVGVMGGRV